MGRPYGSMLPTVGLSSSLNAVMLDTQPDDAFVASAAIRLVDRGRPIDPLPVIEAWEAGTSAAPCRRDDIAGAWGP